MKRHTRSPHHGFVLIETLVGLLLFSLGILGLIAFQAFASQAVSDSRFRTEAVGYADELIALMSVSSPTTLQADFGTGGAKLTAWKTARLSKLPSAEVAVSATPVTESSGAQIEGQFDVSVTIQWQAPGQPQGKYTVSSVVF